MKYKERIPGGLAKGKSPQDYNQKYLEKGVQVELEHTPDRDVAREISMDHLTEDPQYYEKLEEVEKKGLSQPLSLRAFKVAQLHMKSSQLYERNITLMKWLSRITKLLGVAEHTYVVGGAVRNFLISQPIKDLDLVIDSVRAGKDSEWLAKRLAEKIPTQTDITTNQYGVAILSIKGDWDLDGDNLQGEVIEIANARKESYGGSLGKGKGYKPTEVVPATIEEDVYRREFSFNTMLWRLLDLEHGPERAQVIDLTGCGIRDLKNRVLQCPRDPDIVFSDDASRILRSIKFTGRYGFKIPPDVVQSIQRNAHKMKTMPWEAIATILIKDILNQSTARQSLVQMKSLGILDVLSEMIREQRPFTSYMASQLHKNRNVALLLDMMDLGFTARTPISFLSPSQQKQLRYLTIALTKEQVEDFIEDLIKPPVNNLEVIETLGLADKERGKIIPIARQILLDNPEFSRSQLTREVIQELSR